MNGAIIASARYLIRLYYQTKIKYQCSLSKIDKLLSIANFTSIKQENQLFDETMSINQCGTSFPVISWVIREDIMDGINEDFSTIDINSIDENADYPFCYESEYPIEDKKDLLKNIFIRFGSTSTKALGLQINEFVDEISTTVDDFSRPIIDYEKAKEFFQNDERLEKYRDNKIVLFIKEISKVEKTNNNRLNLTPAGDNGYEYTEKELEIIKTHQRGKNILPGTRCVDTRYPNPIELPKLYLSKEEREEVYDKSIGRVLKKLK